MKNVLLVANPASGRGRAPAAVARLVAELGKRGIEASVRFTVAEQSDAALDAAILAAHVVVAMGGDGTLNRVVRPIVLAAPRETPAPAVAVLPMGTANVAVRAFGLSRRPREVAEGVASGVGRPVDAGVVFREGRPAGVFLLWLGAGLDAALIHAVASRRSRFRGLGLKLQYVLEAPRTFGAYRFPRIHVEADDLGSSFAGVMVANVGRLAIGGITARAVPDDGALDCIATLPRTRAGWSLALLLASFNLFDRCPGVSRTRAVRVRLTAARSVPVQIDGEPFGHLPVEVKVLPRALRLVV